MSESLLEMMQALQEKRRHKPQEEYFVVTATSYVDAFKLTARERWKMRHREERMRRKGCSENEIRGPQVTGVVMTFHGMRIVG